MAKGRLRYHLLPLHTLVQLLRCKLNMLGASRAAASWRAARSSSAQSGEQ
jgi:hypothetical protein